jgi:hypothetical protein
MSDGKKTRRPMIFECVLKIGSIENQVMILSKKEKEKNLVYP